MNSPTPQTSKSSQMLPTPSSSRSATHTQQQVEKLKKDIQQQLEEKEQQWQQCQSGIQKSVLNRQINQLREHLSDIEKQDNPATTLDKLRHLERDLASYRGQQRKDKLLSSRDVLPSPSTSTLSPANSSLLPLPPPPTGSTPTKRRSKVPNNDRRNTDIEFATEIGQGLLIEVRKMQAILQEKEEQLRALEIQKADLERSAEAMAKQLRQREENEEKLKEESWNLELTKQELTLSVTELQQHLHKANNEQTKLSKQVNDLKTEIDQLRDKEEKMTSLLETTKQRHELDMSSLRRHCAGLQREAQQHLKQIDTLTSELAIVKAQSRLGQHQQQSLGANEDGTSHLSSSDNNDSANDNHSKNNPDPSESTSSPPGSPKQLPRSSQAMEVETLKSSLAHAHRMVSNLRSHLHKEKTEKFELKKLLAESQETIEQYQNDPYLWVDTNHGNQANSGRGGDNNASVSFDESKRRKLKHRRGRKHHRVGGSGFRTGSIKKRSSDMEDNDDDDDDDDISDLSQSDDSDDMYSSSSISDAIEEEDDEDATYLQHNNSKHRSKSRRIRSKKSMDSHNNNNNNETLLGFTSLSAELSKSSAQIKITTVDAHVMTDPIMIIDPQQHDHQLQYIQQLENWKQNKINEQPTLSSLSLSMMDQPPRAVNDSTTQTEMYSSTDQFIQTDNLSTVDQSTQMDNLSSVDQFTQIEIVPSIDQSTQMEMTSFVDQSTQMDVSPSVDQSTQIEIETNHHEIQCNMIEEHTNNMIPLNATAAALAGMATGAIIAGNDKMTNMKNIKENNHEDEVDNENAMQNDNDTTTTTTTTTTTDISSSKGIDASIQISNQVETVDTSAQCDIPLGVDITTQSNTPITLDQFVQHEPIISVETSTQHDVENVSSSIQCDITHEQSVDAGIQYEQHVNDADVGIQTDSTLSQQPLTTGTTEGDWIIHHKEAKDAEIQHDLQLSQSVVSQGWLGDSTEKDDEHGYVTVLDSSIISSQPTDKIYSQEEMDQKISQVIAKYQHIPQQTDDSLPPSRPIERPPSVLLDKATRSLSTSMDSYIPPAPLKQETSTRSIYPHQQNNMSSSSTHLLNVPNVNVDTEEESISINQKRQQHQRDSASLSSVTTTTQASIASSTQDDYHTGSVATDQPLTTTTTSMDPTISSITQTMIGEWLTKYTRKPMGGQGFSERSHERYFWIHPYTRTLYWCNRAPGAEGGELKAKSAFVENVMVGILEEDGIPCLLIQTSTRLLKVKASTRERHDIWLESLNYLVTRQPQQPNDASQTLQHSNSLLASPSPIFPQRSVSASILRKPSFQRINDVIQQQRNSGSLLQKQYSQQQHQHVHDDDDDDDDDDALENVRLCCNGKHDVSRLDKNHHHHRPSYYQKSIKH
ncbi:hypothetical protein BJ944DRAFT_244199 [Cunninghamella echinulata]|nr:hypothetical protein BJ944DRAFT_244199 [Cunninghamella echinulata]